MVASSWIRTASYRIFSKGTVAFGAPDMRLLITGRTAGRLAPGFGAGAVCAVLVLYMSEIAPRVHGADNAIGEVGEREDIAWTRLSPAVSEFRIIYVKSINNPGRHGKGRHHYFFGQRQGWYKPTGHSSRSWAAAASISRRPICRRISIQHAASGIRHMVYWQRSSTRKFASIIISANDRQEPDPSWTHGIDL